MLKGWKNRVSINIFPDKVKSDLKDFPVLIFIRKSSGRNKKDLTFIFDELQNDNNRKRIAVTLADGVTQLPVEIESWDHNKKEARLWVKLPHVSSKSTTTFYLYFDRNQEDNINNVSDLDSKIAKDVFSSYDTVHHFRPNPQKRITFFQYQKKLLELIFPKNWFEKTRKINHPAYLRWKLCKRLIDQKGIIKFPQPKNEFLEIARVSLDSAILSKITGSDMKKLNLGALNYGDETIQEKIRSRVVDENQFGDIMVELSTGAWYISQGHNVTPLEKEGFPDLRVEFKNSSIPAFIECKHLRTKTERRLIDIVRKANSQIKKVEESCYGVLLVDASLPVSADTVTNDELPKKVKNYESLLRKTLCGNKNKSVGSVILPWDDSMLFGKPPKKQTLFALRRRFIRVDHTNPLTSVPKRFPLFDGYMIDFFVTWSKNKQFIVNKSDQMRILLKQSTEPSGLKEKLKNSTRIS